MKWFKNLWNQTLWLRYNPPLAVSIQWFISDDKLASASWNEPGVNHECMLLLSYYDYVVDSYWLASILVKWFMCGFIKTKSIQFNYKLAYLNCISRTSYSFIDLIHNLWFCNENKHFSFIGLALNVLQASLSLKPGEKNCNWIRYRLSSYQTFACFVWKKSLQWSFHFSVSVFGLLSQ